MAREIKFRAWVNGFLPAQSGMFYGLDLYRNTISGGYDRIGVWRNNNRYHFKSEEEPFELMQYTGLKDKNGVEIYEGDIVKAENVWEVIWQESSFWAAFSDGKLEDEIPLVDLVSLHPEVIGNIYEEPR